MPNIIIRNIPNGITSCNLFCGCIASYMAFQSDFRLAMLFIVLGAVFDFFDGMSARLLKVSSPIGKELDSLADNITFGLAPSAIVFSLFKEIHIPDFMSGVSGCLPYAAFIISVFSALRLAKFNLDERQTTSFIGMPTPANALFWSSLAICIDESHCMSQYFNAFYLLLLVVIMSLLLVSELPMFSLKFKNLTWKDNKIKYIFLAVSVALLLVYAINGLAAVIIWYIILSAFTFKKS
ncbi:CDP-diacylglycerol--serine O-phosphatidyltransferase [Bacteroides caecigallinarum]|uniref:CDP-diacylglycerol--serine O-phosphatidyltransferase n=1 Tax=Bacteroides caecigallinarum TaxID=1411144 RepID=UPI001F1E7795|nr:CDP-diacylglycerol--serine O-phosphatidyltransferase [Bacteroides caecigallinarum]MCF2737356.1 CDP-diacylglycerol--serine O-phosphatidyltransferase [Bacteroides caecigallinarum]MDN0072304.1 CDP-diacylglycerol--serine O-phosphatidyltransferase [Bacteroides caecigallinarum]